MIKVININIIKVNNNELDNVIKKIDNLSLDVNNKILDNNNQLKIEEEKTLIKIKKIFFYFY